MIETGIPKLDEFLGGGIPKGKSLIYYIQPGVEGEVFGMQTVYRSLKSGRTSVFVASSTIPEIIRSQFKEFGWDISSYQDRFFFVDAYNQLPPYDSGFRFRNHYDAITIPVVNQGITG